MKHLGLLFSALLLSVSAVCAATPAWWADPETNIFDSNIPDGGRDFAPVTSGQLKHVATQAKKYLDQELGLSVYEWTDAYRPFQNPFNTDEFDPNPAIQANMNNLAPVTVGQLKFVASGFYNILDKYGIDTKAALKAVSGDSWDHDLPWDPNEANPNDYAPVNIGQLKFVFSFDVQYRAVLPLKPIITSITNDSNTSITITWTGNVLASEFELKRTIDDVLDTSFTQTVAEDVTTFTDTNIPSDGDYCYTVTGINWAGTRGPESDPKCIAIQSELIRTGFNYSYTRFGTSVPVDLGFSIDFYDGTYSGTYINEDGNISFETKLSQDFYNVPQDLKQSGKVIMAPFWGDVETIQNNNYIKYGKGTAKAGNAQVYPAFAVLWENVTYYQDGFYDGSYYSDGKQNTFQLVIISRPDLGSGAFELEYNYEKIQWETGDGESYFSMGTYGYGGIPARAGFAYKGQGYELDGSGQHLAFTDLRPADPGANIIVWADPTLYPANSVSNTAKGLTHNSYNSPLTGRYAFNFVNGAPVNDLLPQVFAGNDHTITTLPWDYTLDSSITPPAITTQPYDVIEWVDVDNTGNVSFNSTSVEAPAATFTEAGTYTLKLSVSNGVNTISDTVTIIVKPVGSELTLSDDHAGNITLTYASVPGGSNYDLQRSIDDGAWVSLDSLSSPAQYTDTYILDDEGSSYCYRVILDGDLAKVSNVECSSIIFKPDPPTAFTYDDSYNINYIDLFWVDSNLADYYLVERSVNGGEWYNFLPELENYFWDLAFYGDQAIFDYPETGNDYCYRITSIHENSAGAVQYSDPVQLCLPPGFDIVTARSSLGTAVPFTSTNEDAYLGPITLSSLGFTADLNYYGNTYSEIFISENGFISFVEPIGAFDDQLFANAELPMIAPFYANVDRASSPGSVSYSSGVIDGSNALVVDWTNVGYFDNGTDKLNTFQLVIIEQGSGDFNIEFNYEKIEWDTADSEGGSGGLGALSARMGFVGDGMQHEISGSSSSGTFLDVNRNSGLIFNTDSEQDLIGGGVMQGRYMYSFESGLPAHLTNPDAGNPISAVLGSSPFLHDTAAMSEDEYPVTAFLTWTDVSDASEVNGEAIFVNRSILHPEINFTGVGKYTLRLAANDVESIAYDEVEASVSLSDPVLLSAVKEGYNHIKLSWEAVPTATGYDIYRDIDEFGTYTLIESVAGDLTSYVTGGVTESRAYYYKIRATYDEVSGLDSGLSNVVSATPDLDLTAPTVTLFPANNSTVKDSLGIYAEYSDSPAGVDLQRVEVFVKLQGSAGGGQFIVEDWEIAPDRIQRINTLADGIYEIFADVHDLADNQTTSSTHTITIDNTPPVIAPIAIDGTVTANTTPNINITYSDVSGIDTSSVFVIINEVDRTTDFDITTSSASLKSGVTLTGGTYDLKIYVSDNPGSRAEAEASFTIDKTGPTIEVEPQDGVWVTTASPSLLLNYSDASGSVKFNDLIVVVDSGSVTTTVVSRDNSGAEYSFDSVLSEGQHDVVITLEDQFSNATTENVSFQVDSQLPVITITQPVNLSSSKNATPQFSFTVADLAPASGLDMDTLSITLNGEDVKPQFSIEGTTATYEPLIPLGDDTYNFTVSIKDVAGNIATVTHTFTVDNEGPIISSTPDVGEVVTNVRPNFSISFSDATPASDLAKLNFSASLLHNAVTTAPPFTVDLVSATWTPTTDLAEGAYELTLTASDDLGNQREVIVPFIIDHLGPVLTVHPDNTTADLGIRQLLYVTYNDKGSTIDYSSFTATVTDTAPGGTVYDYSNDFILNPFNAHFYASLPDGNYDLVVNISDVHTHQSSSTVNFTVSSANDSDADGLPDSWEALYAGLDAANDDALEDLDGDGASNIHEFLFSSIPNNKDSDLDELEDGWEIFYGFDANNDDRGTATNFDPVSDYDGDGESNLDEFNTGGIPTYKESEWVPFIINGSDAELSWFGVQNKMYAVERSVSGGSWSKLNYWKGSDNAINYAAADVTSSAYRIVKPTGRFEDDLDGDGFNDYWEIINFYDLDKAQDLTSDNEPDGVPDYQDGDPNDDSVNDFDFIIITPVSGANL